MAVTDFLQDYDNRVNPLMNPTAAPNLISNSIKPVRVSDPSKNYSTPGSTVSAILANSKNNAQNLYNSNRSKSTGDLAQRVLKQSAGTIPTDKYGIVQRAPSSFGTTATNNLGTINQAGKTALAGAQSKATWQQLNKLQNQQTNGILDYNPTDLPPGSTGDNPGARAVAIALQAYKDHTPYTWGGNSLTNGVDCSGLVQQAYAKLGIKLPRTTYEQAKSGQVISGVENALPGDLVFYNTGGSDPNGIGKNSHVAIYIGNGMVLEAYNSKVGLRESRINYAGNMSTIVRPWS